MVELYEDFVYTYEVYNCITSPILCHPEKPNRKWYRTLTTPQNCIITPLWNEATLRCTACLGSKLRPWIGVMVELYEDFVYTYEVYNCITSPILCHPEKPNRKWYQTLTTPQNCIITPLWNEATFRCTACLGSKLRPWIGVMVELYEDFVYTYEVYNCITSPILCHPEKPNRKWYQTLTTPQNCIITPLWNEATLRCTACLGSKLRPWIGVMVELYEDFVYTYEVYNCITSPILCHPEKPNRKWYQTLTTPQNCIITPLWNEATLRCTACLGSKLRPWIGVMVELYEDFVYTYEVYNCITSPILCHPEKPNRKWYRTLTTPQIVSSLLSGMKPHSGAQLA